MNAVIIPAKTIVHISSVQVRLAVDTIVETANMSQLTGYHYATMPGEPLLAAVPVEEAAPLDDPAKLRQLAVQLADPDCTGWTCPRCGRTTNYKPDTECDECSYDISQLIAASPGPVAGAVQDLTVGEAAMPVEVLRWIVNVARGVGRAGGLPDSGEWEAALEAGRVALMRDVLGPKVAGAVPAPQWQPIESAPKDGTEVLVFDEGVMIVAPWIDLGDGRAGFYDSALIEPPPTHWMPLPSPPRSEQDETK